VYSQDAFRELTPILHARGRPISLVDGKRQRYVGFHVADVIDALDREASDLTSFSSGRLMTIDRHVFRPQALRDAVIFRLPDFEGGGWTYVTDEYVAAVEATKLLGAEFDLVWSAKDTLGLPRFR
jgi:hypothetical protein